MRLVDAVSLRSRRRKLRLFLDEVRPTAATTVLDVGADEVGFGHDGGQSGCGTHNFFEELYPWPHEDIARIQKSQRHLLALVNDVPCG